MRKRKEVIERGKKQTTKKETQKCLQSTKKREIRKKRYKHVPIFCERKGCCSVMRIIQFIVGNKVDLSHTQKNEKKGLTIHSKNALCHVILERKKAFFFVFETSYFIFLLSLERREEKTMNRPREKRFCLQTLRPSNEVKKIFCSAHKKKILLHSLFVFFYTLFEEEERKKRREKEKTFTTRIAITSNAHDTKKNYDCCVA